MDSFSIRSLTAKLSLPGLRCKRFYFDYSPKFTIYGGAKKMGNNNVHKKTRGKCLCGQVQFEIRGELRDIVNCHCSKCRKFHGNYGAYTSVKVENLKIAEQKSLKWYKSPADETANVHRGFFSECGSSLFWHPKDQPNIAIAAGSTDSPTNLKTIGHVWCSQISDFYKIEDDLPQFDERWNT